MIQTGRGGGGLDLTYVASPLGTNVPFSQYRSLGLCRFLPPSKDAMDHHAAFLQPRPCIVLSLLLVRTVVVISTQPMTTMGLEKGPLHGLVLQWKIWPRHVLVSLCVQQ